MIIMKKHVSLYIVFYLLRCANSGFTTTKIGPQPIWNATYTDKLRQDLLLNYDKYSRPAQHYNVTTVRFGLYVRHIEFNEFKSTLTVNVWLRMIWTDEKLKWDPIRYGNISLLHLAEHELWQPDIYLYNSATSSAVNQFGNTHFRVYSNGEVLWVPPAQLSVICKLNLKYWPFDRQECFLKFGSWTYSGDEIDLLQLDDNGVRLELIIHNSEWELTKVVQSRNEKYYSCCTEAYPDITVNMTLSRISTSYRAIIVTPAFVVIIMTMLSFALPPQAGEKIVINACTAIIVCLFTMYFTQKVPVMGVDTPLIVMFYTSCLYITSFSMIGSVIVISLSRTKQTTSLPWIIKRPLIGKFGKFLGLKNYIYQTANTNSHRVTAEEMRDHQVAEFDDSQSDDNHIIKSQLPFDHSSLQKDWILLAAAIDRISFIFYFFLFFILSIVYTL